MSDVYNPNEHPRDAAGRWANKVYGDTGQLGLEDQVAEEHALRDVARRAARNANGKWLGRLDVEDLTGVTIIEMLRQRERDANSTDATRQEVAARSWTEMEGQANLFAANLAGHMMLGHRPSYETKAYNAYKAEVDKFTEANKRMPSMAESDAIAERIRMAGKPGRRAPRGFHRRAANQALIERPERLTYTGSDGSDVERTDTALRSSAADAWIGDPGVDEGDKVPQRLAFKMFAETEGVAVPRERSIDEDDACAVREAIAESGGHETVAQALRTGRANMGADSFAYMFDNLNDDDRRDLGAMLCKHKRSTAALMESAIAFATRSGHGELAAA